MAVRIAYLVNQYPKVSHSFIRREIQALERQGAEIERYALRGWQSELVDAEDRSERERTRYVLREGVVPVIGALIGTALTRPRLFIRAFVLATRMARRSDRPLPYHWIYLAEACRVARWLRASGTRHVHAHFGTNSAEVAMLAALLAAVTYSFTAHGSDETDRPEFLGLPEKIRRAAMAVAVSSYGRSQLFRWSAVASWPKIRVVHCGLDAAFHAGVEPRPSESPRLVCVGRLCKEKGQLLLLAALRRVLDAGMACELVLVGDGEMRADIEAQIARLDLNANVRITGWVSGAGVRAEILAARALVAPSFAEGLPVVIMEALALYRPVLASHIAGIPELVTDGECGWLFPAGDVERLASAMQACCAASLAQLQAMGAAGRARVLERHDVDREAHKLLGYFTELVGGAGAR